ncbi:MAG: hypothetical protein AAFR52_09625, partial [Pseudomonadota bacterium]
MIDDILLPDTILFTIEFGERFSTVTRLASYSPDSGFTVFDGATQVDGDALPLPDRNFDFVLRPLGLDSALLAYEPLGAPAEVFLIDTAVGVRDLTEANGSAGSQPGFALQQISAEFGGIGAGGLVDPNEGIELVRVDAGGEIAYLDTDLSAPGLQTIRPGPAASLPTNFIEFSGRVFFNAISERGEGLFYIDRDGQTVVEFDAAPEIPNIQPLPIDLQQAVVIGDALFAFSTRETGEGTTRGTVRISPDLEIDYLTVEQNSRIEPVSVSNIRDVAVPFGDALAFPGLVFVDEDGAVTGFDTNPDRDGTQPLGGGSQILGPFGDGLLIELPSQLTVFDDPDVRPSEFAVFDGTEFEPVVVGESLGTGVLRGNGFFPVGDAVYLVGSDDEPRAPFPEGSELWRIGPDGVADQVDFDPTVPGIQTALLGPRDGGFDDLLSYNGLLYFRVIDDATGFAYYTADEAGTVTRLTPGEGFAEGEGIGLLGPSPLGTPWLPVGEDVLVRSIGPSQSQELLRVVDGRFDRIDIDPDVPGIQPAGGDFISDFFGTTDADFTYLTGDLPVIGGTGGGGGDPSIGEGLTPAEAREVALLYETGLDRDGDID